MMMMMMMMIAQIRKKQVTPMKTMTMQRTVTSHKETPPQCSKKQRRLYDEDVEDEDRNNRARLTTLSMECKSSGRKENGESTAVNLDVPICGMSKSQSRRNQQEYVT